jgi:hypothetical protein
VKGPRGLCSRMPDCDGEEHQLYRFSEDEPWLCPDHYRREAVDTKWVQACDTCGATPAFRVPGHRRNEYLCLEHHAEQGYTLDDMHMLRKLWGQAPKRHPLGRTAECIAAGHGTECRGEIKQRGKLGMMCTRHFDPQRYNRTRV